MELQVTISFVLSFSKEMYKNELPKTKQKQ